MSTDPVAPIAPISIGAPDPMGRVYMMREKFLAISIRTEAARAEWVLAAVSNSDGTRLQAPDLLAAAQRLEVTLHRVAAELLSAHRDAMAAGVL